mgnify:CR=1 FL=1
MGNLYNNEPDFVESVAGLPDYEKGYINKVITTNLTYLPAELYKKPYFVKADMSKFLALIIDSLNHDTSVNDIMNATKRIQELLEERSKNISSK